MKLTRKGASDRLRAAGAQCWYQTDNHDCWTVDSLRELVVYHDGAKVQHLVVITPGQRLRVPSLVNAMIRLGLG